MINPQCFRLQAFLQEWHGCVPELHRLSERFPTRFLGISTITGSPIRATMVSDSSRVKRRSSWGSGHHRGSRCLWPDLSQNPQACRRATDRPTKGIPKEHAHMISIWVVASHPGKPPQLAGPRFSHAGSIG